jgi:hypothetical protein
MPILVSDSGGNGNFTPHPEGSYGAVCVDVHDLGLVESVWEGVKSMKHKLEIYFFCGEWTEKNGDGDVYPMLVRKRFTATLHENGALRPWLEAWRGKKFTPQELAGFDVESLIGAGALIQVSHNVSDGKTYANIDFAGRLPKGMTPVDPPQDFKRRHIRDAEKAAAEQAEKVGAGVGVLPWDAKEPTDTTDYSKTDDLPFN